MAGKGGRMGRYAFKLLCPEPLVSSVMGSRGATKDAIQAETGSRLVVSNRDEYFPSTRFRVLVVYSDEASGVLGALDRIVNHVAECAELEQVKQDGKESDFLGKEPGEVVIRALIPVKASGAIIGPKGSNIQALRDDNQAKIFIDKNNVQGHQVIKLISGVDSLRSVLVRLNDCVQAEAHTEAFQEWAAVRNFGSGHGPADGGHRGSDRHHEDRGRDDHRSGRGERRRSRSRRRRSRSRGGGGRGHSDRHDGGFGMPPPQQHHEPLLMGLARGLAAFPEGSLQLEYVITCDLPTSKVSALIGKRGEHITFVRRTTQTQVHFDEAAGGTDNPMQQMSIKGPLAQVYRAHALMMRRYHESELSAPGGPAPSSPPAAVAAVPDVSSLQNHIADLQKQLEMVRAQQSGGSLLYPNRGGGGGGGGGKGKGKKGR